MPIIAIIPAYNSEVHLRDVISRTKLYADEIVVVDDGSEDATNFIAESMGVAVVKHERHEGRSRALQDGFAEGLKYRPSIIVILNADGSHDPDDIPKVTGAVMREEADVACACYGEDCDRQTSGFCALSGKVFKHLENATDEIQMLQEMSEAGCTFEYVSLHNSAPAEEELLQKYRIGVVVPAYNEENLIQTTIEGIPDYVDRIYVVNDCSSDNTAQVLEDIEDPRVFVITHEVNKGVGAALISGYKRSLKEGMDIVAVMAGDNQMNPDQLPKLLMPIIEGKADYTKGNRLFSAEFRGGMSRWRTLGNGLLTMITKIGSGYWHIMDPQNGYTAISRKALANIGLDEIYTYYGYCNHMLVRLNAFGFRTLDVVMPARYGNEKSTIKYGPYMVKVSLMLFRSFLWRLKMKYMILNFHPLVLFYTLSMIMLPAGVLFGLYILIRKMLSLSVSANYPLLDAVILIAGLQFLLFAMLFDMQESERDMRSHEMGSKAL